MKKYIILIFTLLFFLQIKISYPQSIDSLYILEPEKYIANEIFTHRITMLGEFIHYQPITHFNFIEILNNWFEQLKKDDKANSNLTIVLECDSTTGALIDNYVKSGDIRPLLDFVSPNFPLEALEQFYEYRKIYKRIEIENRKRKNKITFCLKGFEEISYNIVDYYFNLNQEEQELWFVNDRDKFTSTGIIKYLKENPEQNIIIFYGGAHLVTGIANKNLGGFSIPQEKCMGKWLAQYLIDELGEENINIVMSTALNESALLSSDFKELVNKKFLIKKPYEKYYNLNQKGINKYLINTFINIPTHNINYALSRYIVEKSVERIKQFEKFTGYKAASGRSVLNFINIMYNTDLRNYDDIKKWIEDGGPKEFDFLDSNSFYKNIYDYSNRIFEYYYSQSYLPQIGFTPSISSFLSSNWDNSIWPEALKNIKFINAVEIFWVGYPDEKEKAKKYLTEFSGKDFDEPAEYLQWWRREYCKIKI
jgi:hypothetical protein